MITRNHRQESLSRAYVQAIASSAGVICAWPEFDYGVDVSIRVVDKSNKFVDRGVQLDLQLKSTMNPILDLTHIGIDLRVSDYDRLRSEDLMIPSILVAMIVPEAGSDWLTQTHEALTLRKAAYWTSLRGMPAKEATSTVRIRIPRENLFSSVALIAIHDRIRSGGAP